MFPGGVVLFFVVVVVDTLFAVVVLEHGQPLGRVVMCE